MGLSWGISWWQSVLDEGSELRWVVELGCGLECVVVWFHCDEGGCEVSEMGRWE